MEEILELFRVELKKLEGIHGKIQKYNDFGWVQIKFQDGTYCRMTIYDCGTKATLDKCE